MLLSLVLVILAIVIITKIIQIHAAEVKQEKEIKALQQEYISNSSDKNELTDKPAASSSGTDEATEDDPNAWYHDIDVDDDFKEFVEDTIFQGSYVDADIDVDDETHIITLSTCSYDSDVRFTVSAVRVDEHVSGLN